MKRFLVGGVLLAMSCAKSLSIEGYCEEEPLARCLATQRCGGISKAVTCTRPEDVSACVAGLKHAQEHSRLTFDGVGANACIEAITAASCGGQWDVRCNLWLGGAKEGQSCGFCESGLKCMRDGNTRCGVCEREPEPVPPPGPGEPCDGICARGSYCEDGTCRQSNQKGSTCTVDS